VKQLRIDAFGATHKGNIRTHNEDNIYVEGAFRNELRSDNVAIKGQGGKASSTYAVFDGLGGERCGEDASYIAALGLKNFDERDELSNVEDYVSTVNKAICNEAVRRGARTIGTTCVMLRIDGDKAHISNVGDSRAYVFRDGDLKQLSRDQSVVQSMIEIGFIDEKERYTNVHAGELRQYVGMTSEEDIEPQPDLVTTDVRPGDIFLLCSDGLSSELMDDRIADIIRDNSDRDARQITAILIKEVLEKQARDNVSAVVCRVE
jgi:serine/threonine protein phosphatase PrpC